MSNVKPFTVTRVFNAPVELVYKVNTEVEHLKKWFGPAGTKVIQFKMNFKVGGINLYGLEIMPGVEMWGKQTYVEIVPNQKIVLIQSFSDKDGNITTHPMSPTWPKEMLSTTTFEAEGKQTRVTISWHPHNSDAVGENTFDTSRESMTGGFKGMMDTLETYLGGLV